MMKRTLLTSAAIAAFVFTGCSSDDEPAPKKSEQFDTYQKELQKKKETATVGAHTGAPNKVLTKDELKKLQDNYVPKAVDLAKKQTSEFMPNSSRSSDDQGFKHIDEVNDTAFTQKGDISGSMDVDAKYAAKSNDDVASIDASGMVVLKDYGFEGDDSTTIYLGGVAAVGIEGRMNMPNMPKNEADAENFDMEKSVKDAIASVSVDAKADVNIDFAGEYKGNFKLLGDFFIKNSKATFALKTTVTSGGESFTEEVNESFDLNKVFENFMSVEETPEEITWQ